MKKVLFTILLINTLNTFCASTTQQNNLNLAFMGTGYVGLISGAGLAEVGHRVICADIDKNKIEGLKQGIIPIYEPGLEQLVEKNVAADRLVFTHDIGQAIQQSNIIFIAVGTPTADDGKADLSYVRAVAKTIGQNLNGYKVVVTKSTVPIGTGKIIRSIIKEHAPTNSMFNVVSNPEFLREGCAIKDFLNPDRIVIGTESDQAQQIMADVYQPFTLKEIPIVMTNIETSEAIKYASNAFLAMKVAYINELARLCDITSANIETIAYAMGLDNRISYRFLKSGPGFGGSCFPKDVLALTKMGKEYQVDLKIVNATLASNETQKIYIVRQVEKLMNNDISGKTIAILGLAFKANTDDIRSASSITIIKELLDKGVIIRAYDPEAMDNMKKLYPDITYCSSCYDAAKEADATIILTEWQEFKDMDIEKIATLMKHRNLIDTRNIINQKQLQQLQFNYSSLGTGQSIN